MENRRFMTPLEGVCLAALVLGLVIWLFFPRGAGAKVVLTRGGEELGRYALDVPYRAGVQGENGFSLVLVIEGGRAHVEESTCPDLICQHHAPISQAGESIICLPGQIVLRVEGGDRLGADAVSG